MYCHQTDKYTGYFQDHVRHQAAWGSSCNSGQIMASQSITENTQSKKLAPLFYFRMFLYVPKIKDFSKQGTTL